MQDLVVRSVPPGEVPAVAEDLAAGTPAAGFYESRGYVLLEIPDYSRMSDGTLWPGTIFYRLVEA